MRSSTLIDLNQLFLIVSLGFLNFKYVSGFQIEVHDANPENKREYPWQLCRGRGYKNSGTGDQVFAIDRRVTTCEKEDGFVEWFDRPVPAGLNPTPFTAVNIGAPPPREGSSTRTPIMYTEDPPKGKITMETGVWENSPAQFHIQRKSHFVEEMHYTNLNVLPKDRLWFYWPPLSENLPHGGNPDFRMLLSYRGVVGSDITRLGYTLTRTSTAQITPQHPQVQLFASDGTVWDGVNPLPDEKRPEHIEEVMATQPTARRQPQEMQVASVATEERGLGPDELAARQKKSGSLSRILGKSIGKIGGFFKKKGSNLNANQPVIEREENKEEEKFDPNGVNIRNRGPRWYGDEDIEYDVGTEGSGSPRYSEFGIRGVSATDIEALRRANLEENPQRNNFYPSFYRGPGSGEDDPEDPNYPHGRIGDSNNDDPQ
ncbi:hypothetical protein TWF506_009737 [Arthrobotrys conoides]|uniref:Uncharacterized protein n=1 Tax=Arthrobotrys conoides TaxID=74498 RepID=A0AAN8N7D8_9PEZI